MKQYLLDTNILIYYIKGKYNLDEKIDTIGLENCFISEISLAELKYGAEKSNNPDKNRKIIFDIEQRINILPIYNCLDVYAREKAKLEKGGKPLDDFDLLIGASAIINNLTFVTNNIKHFDRLDEILLEDWTK